MPITEQQMLQLKYGDHIYDIHGNRFKVNGMPRREPLKYGGKVIVPIKYGLYDYDYITASNSHLFLPKGKGEDIQYIKQMRQKKPRQSKQKIQVGMKMFNV